MSRLSLAALFAALLLASPAVAEEPPRSISVSGDGVAMRVPDRAAITLGVEETRDTAVEAMNAASNGAEGVIAALRQTGIPEADIATIDISLGPVYRNRHDADGTGEPEVSGYRATNVLRVTVRELGKLGQAIGAATSAGGNTVSSISFETSSRDEAMDEARRLAVEDARRRAETLAAAAGAKLGPILSMTEMNSGPAPRYRMEAAMSADASPVAAGSRAIAASVQATWALTD
jgi:uncharacterized protein